MITIYAMFVLAFPFIDETFTNQCNWDYISSRGEMGGEYGVCDEDGCYCTNHLPDGLSEDEVGVLFNKSLYETEVAND